MINNLSASILARLKSKAKDEGIAFQQLLNLFFQEEFIRRLAQSNYREHLILKGGFLLYAISDFKTRPTVDADYLLKNYSNELDSVERLVRSIIDQKSENDYMDIDIRGIEAASEMREYQGIRVNLIGSLGKTRTPFSIDFGVGDAIFPKALIRTLPVLLDGLEKPTVLTYSLESIISEKLDAIIRFMEVTGRMKDYYDIYFLATSFEFEGRKLREAIHETFSTRGTPFEKDSVLVIERLIANEDFMTRWNNFCKKVLKYELSFSEVVQLIVSFLEPPFQAIINKEELYKNWNSDKKRYQ